MSEKDGKRTAARDISELKARLGIRKDSGGIAVPPTLTGMKPGDGMYVPPPPGMQAPEASVPDARIDPFGAMNAIAARTAQVAPPIVIVDDGKPVESVQKQSVLSRLKWAALILVPLLLGFLIGGISYKNQAYNATIDDAKTLTDEIRSVGAGLINLDNALLEAKERGPEGKDFLPGDTKLTQALESLELTKPDPAHLFHSNLYNMDPKLVEDTLQFYADMSALHEKVQGHIRTAKADARKTGKGSEVLRTLGDGARFGVVIAMPQDERSFPTVELVQVGTPVCENQTASSGGACPGNALPAGFQYRPDFTKPAAWGVKAWSRDTLAPDNILLLTINPVLAAFLKGAEPFADDLLYMQRIREIDGQVQELKQNRKSVENLLNQKAQESKRFSL